MQDNSTWEASSGEREAVVWRTERNLQCNRLRNASDSHLAGVFLSSLRRGFVSRLLCVLLGHVFALPRRAVKMRAFPVVNTCLGVNPHLAMASARRGWIGRFLSRAPCG